jgi:hypothetical protein
MSGKYLKARIQDGHGKTLAKLRIRIPKKYRTKRDEWHHLADAYADGVLEGLAQRLDECS